MNGGVKATVLASQLLREAAGFFDHVAEDNAGLAEMMRDNARAYREVAGHLDSDPAMTVEGLDRDVPVTELAARLLDDAAQFFEQVAARNPETGDGLPETAEAYRMLGDLLNADPGAELPTDA